MATHYLQTTRQPITLGTRIATGGEASIFPVNGKPDVVAKIYTDISKANPQKLEIMLAHPPISPVQGRHSSIAWPTDILIDDTGRCAGFLMPRVSNMKEVALLYNPKRRLRDFPDFHYQYLMQTAYNLASAVEVLHSSGYVIGDISSKNVLATNTALVTIVDTDSFQVTHPHTRKVYRCPVGTGEYTPPEFQGVNFHEVDRGFEQDRFGLGVILFQLLMEGTHPFDGIYAPELQTREERIKSGRFPYSDDNASHGCRPKPLALPFESLDRRLQQLFRLCFEKGHKYPHARPTGKQWAAELKSEIDSLKICSANPQHYYGKHLESCSWCALQKRNKGRDSFPPRKNVSIPQGKVAAVTKPQLNPIQGLTTHNSKDGAELIHIPGGKFLMGDDDRSDNPRHTVELTDYYIYKNLVTVEQYAAYCKAAGKSMPPTPGFNPNWSKGNHPIVNVSWHKARAYAQWAGGDLPSEAQWERAACGMERRKYPWGNEWDASKCWCCKKIWSDTAGTTEVGKYGVSPEGCTDMAGNVWQWCLDGYDAKFWESKNSQVINPVNETVNVERVLRGGSWLNNLPDNFRCARRSGGFPDGGNDARGFRVVFRGLL